jgi:hypothetical protein
MTDVDHHRRSRGGLIICGLSLLAAPADAGVRNGDPSDHPIEWYTAVGAAIRDAVRDARGDCQSHPGEIIICKRRNQYRIDPRVLHADRDSSSSGKDDEYARYLRGQSQ